MVGKFGFSPTHLLMPPTFFEGGSVQQQLGTCLSAIVLKGVVLNGPYFTSFRIQGRGGNEKAQDTFWLSLLMFFFYFFLQMGL